VRAVFTNLIRVLSDSLGITVAFGSFPHVFKLDAHPQIPTHHAFSFWNPE